VSAQVPSIPERPLLKPWYRLLATQDGLLLEHGRSVIAFSGTASRTFLPALLPLLDGRTTVTEIVEMLGLAVAPAVENALALLASHDLLTDGPFGHEPADAGRRATIEALAAETGASPSVLVERLEEAEVGFLSRRPLDERLARLLQECGLHGTTRGLSDERPSTLVLVSEPPEPGELADWNRSAHERGITWLPFGAYDGRTATVGPLVVPGETACSECVAMRRRSTSGCPAELAQLRHVGAACACPPDLEQLLTALAARVVLRWLLLRDPFLPGLLVTIEGGSEPAVTTHVALRVPRCPVCSGASGLAPPAPWHEPRIEATLG